MILVSISGQRTKTSNPREYRARAPPAGSVIPSVISTPSLLTYPHSSRVSSIQELNPVPAGNASSRKTTRSVSKRDPAAAPVDAKPERDQLPTMNADQTVTQIFHSVNLEAQAGDLASVGCVMVV